ncbi:baseplate multidomain protein megatron [Rhizobium rhododendri]|uniref:Glycoside hydrolase/phage tail family protein n=1 Tax=Rhizobium rhododendri TaxID=2506430 RepID=A0ABY8IIS5_9HYPH|nr:glycoside hydrolase/phage tail family protein [Rhizobium rhododendri]WFS23597.1 glycoside hydrolase/phage tail family protein [Rhizobium rhododendri]
MATILFQAAGAALGSVFGPVGAMIGRAAGALAGSVVDKALINGSRTVSGARMATARIPGADEGAAIIWLYGTARLGGTLIWATRFEEEVSTERSGGKSTGSRVETFRYFANFAVGLCEGPIACIRRVWADGKEVDLTQIEMRVYRGSEDQLADPLIEAKQGAGHAPAYRGIAYVVFERLPLDTFGNRIPLFQFEVVRPIGRLERQIRAVTIIPGSTEHGYSTTRVTEKTGAGSMRAINRNVLTATTDWQASLDELTALCPNLKSVALVVAWFGTDLRAGHCRIVPGVETLARDSESSRWSVSGINRADAHLISLSEGTPAYGGTPDDASVLQAIADLRQRGLGVFIYPFLMMDIPLGNGLPDPEGAGEQAAYPWRGRITAFPAIGRPGTVDRTAVTGAQVAAFCGAASSTDFSMDGAAVAYHGTDEGYRRMLLHYAHLAVAGGGVDGFIIGSELRGLTQLRDAGGSFPFVQALATMATDIRAIVGPATRLTYGADWSEYFGYHPDDGSGDVYFHLDPLWASPDIDAVGIDNYMPLSDWRDDDLAKANPDGFRIQDDLAGMTAAIDSGEGFDWYYSSAADRIARDRSAISDGLAAKPWVFRYKDIGSWWSSLHYERVGGVERTTPTAWVPHAKPIWLTELGCPAMDKGANQPNVFLDPKSVESAAPYFSNCMRADSVQRRFLEAHHDHWAGSGVVDPNRIFVWTWDARPYPAFPVDTGLWSDGSNWRTGHWLNGRLGAGTLADVIAAILTDQNFTDFDVSEVSGDLSGYAQGDVTSARDMLTPLLEIFQIDVIEDGPVLRFRSRAAASLAPILISAVVDVESQPLWQETRGHDSDFAAEAIVTFYDPLADYEQASVRSRRAPSASNRVLRNDLGAVVPEEAALQAAENLLRDNRASRRSVTLSLSPTASHLQPGDVISMADGPEGRFLVTRIEDGAARSIEAREFASLGGGAIAASTPVKASGGGAASDVFAPVVELMDLPQFESGSPSDFACGAVYARPWRTTVLSSSPSTEAFARRVMLDRPAKIGSVVAPLFPGVSGRFDWSQSLTVDLAYGGLESALKISVLNGANRFAVQSVPGMWEIGAFIEAEEIAAKRWRLSGLLRGLAGTEDATAAGIATHAPFVILDAAVKPLGLASGEMGLHLNWIAEAPGSNDRAGPIVFAGGIRAETPLSPVHIAGSRNAEGAAVFTWIRRGRIDADNWIPSDIALDEPTERYRVDLMQGGVLKRRVEVVTAGWTYSAGDEIADFGATQPHLEIVISQMGQRVPIGIPAAAVVAV